MNFLFEDWHEVYFHCSEFSEDIENDSEQQQILIRDDFVSWNVLIRI